MRVNSLLAIARQQHDAFTWRQAVDTLGKDRFLRMLRDDFARRVHPRTYVLGGSPQSWQQACWAAVLSAPGSALYGTSAARWHGLSVTTQSVDLAVLPGGPRVRTGVGLVEVGKLETMTARVRGLPVVRVNHALISATPALDAEHFERLLREALMARKTTLVSLGKDVAKLPANQTGRLGPLIEALASMTITDQKVESWFEAEVLGWIREAGFPDPVAQHRIVIDVTRSYRPDFCYPEHRIIIEPEGPHHLIPSVARYDRDRRNRLEAMGWHILVVALDTNPRVFMADFTRAWMRSVA